MTAQDLIDFESSIKDLWEKGQLPSLVHLCGGNENELIKVFSEIKEGDYVFSTHRTHYHAFLIGMEPAEIRKKILAGDSMFIYSLKHRFLCSAVLAGCTGIAAGVAWAIKAEYQKQFDSLVMQTWPRSTTMNFDELESITPRVWCFIGDGGEEEGHFYEAAMFVEANDLPCTFIIEDNNRSVDTARDARRGKAKGLEHLFKCVRRYHYTPTYPHAGSAAPFVIKFDPEAIERLKRR